MSVSTTRIYLGVRIVHIFKINRINKSKKEKKLIVFYYAFTDDAHVHNYRHM